VFTLRFLGLALGLAALAGCTTNPQAPARISGTVTYKGSPVPAGTVVFHTPEQGSYAARLNTDGTYEVRDVPKGKMTVTVETESVNPNKKNPETYGGSKGAKQYAERLAAEGRAAAEKTPPEQYMKIPSKYADRETTPLSIDAAAGAQIQNFPLTDD
jgi:hypothetical protein